jgi:nucleotide-binding universal stress UspA family protein
MKTVIAAVDFSSVTPRVVEAAIKLARLAKARVMLLHVVSTPAAIRDVLPAIEDVGMRTRSANHAAEKNLLQVKRAFRRRFSQLEIRHPTGDPAAQIIAEAEALRAIYVVLGSHGRSAIRAALLGSVASNVVKSAPCPVVIIPTMTRAAATRVAA